MSGSATVCRFEDPDAVLRALVVLNGIELPNLENRSDPGKKLIVKADEKTRKFLDEYESMMLRTDVSLVASLCLSTPCLREILQ